MEVLKFPNPALFKRTAEITVFGEELKILLDSMWETMKNSNGIGLAANQVGLTLRMFVMDGPKGRLNLVNPLLINKSTALANQKEGCLSMPGEFIIVPSRVEWVEIEYQNEKGIFKKVFLRGTHSVCAQHELDHLDGIVFAQNKSIDRRKRKEIKKKWKLK